MRLTTPAALLAVAAVAAVAAGCAAGSPSPSPTTAPTSAPTEGQATRVEVTLSDSFRIEPVTIRVPVGQPVTFVVTNTGVLEHEFFVGDEAAQQAHERKMADGGMAHDEPTGIGVAPGQTKELTMTFDAPGATLAGCHVPGHYAAGMKAEIEIGG